MQTDMTSIGQEVARRILGKGGTPTWNDILACVQDIRPEDSDFIKALKILGTDEKVSELIAARTISQYLLIKSSLISESRSILSETAANLAESFLVGLSDFLSVDQPTSQQAEPMRVSPLKVEDSKAPGFPKVPIAKPLEPTEPATIYDDGQSSNQLQSLSNQSRNLPVARRNRLSWQALL